jgi:hypothetical protein
MALQNKVKFGRAVVKDVTIKDLNVMDHFDTMVEQMRERYMEQLPDLLLSYGSRQPLELVVSWSVSPHLGVRKK